MNNFFVNVLTFSIAPLLSSFQISYSFYPYEGSPFPFHPPKDMHISPSGTHRTDTEVDYTGEYECSFLPHDLCGTIKACEMPFNYVVSHYGCGDGASLAWKWVCYNGSKYFWDFPLAQTVSPAKLIYRQQCNKYHPGHPSYNDDNDNDSSQRNSSHQCFGVKVRINALPYKTGTVKLKCNNN